MCYQLSGSQCEAVEGAGASHSDLVFSCHFIYCVVVAFHTLVAQMVKCLPTIWEIRVQSLGREDLLEKEMTTQSSILAWEITWTDELGGLQSIGSQRLSD